MQAAGLFELDRRLPRRPQRVQRGAARGEEAIGVEVRAAEAMALDDSVGAAADRAAAERRAGARAPRRPSPTRAARSIRGAPGVPPSRSAAPRRAARSSRAARGTPATSTVTAPSTTRWSRHRRTLAGTEQGHARARMPAAKPCRAQRVVREEEVLDRVLLAPARPLQVGAQECVDPPVVLRLEPGPAPPVQHDGRVGGSDAGGRCRRPLHAPQLPTAARSATTACVVTRQPPSGGSGGRRRFPAPLGSDDAHRQVHDGGGPPFRRRRRPGDRRRHRRPAVHARSSSPASGSRSTTPACSLR